MHRLMLREPYRNILQRALQQQSIRHYHNSGFPPHMQEAGLGRIVLILSPIVVTGGVVTYAKYDKNFRKTVEQNVPGSESAFKYLLQEVQPLDGIKKQFDGVTKQINTAVESVTGLFSRAESNEQNELENVELKTPPPQPTTKEFTSPTSTKPSTTAISLTPSPKPAEPTPFSPIIPATKPEEPVEELPLDIVELERGVEVAASLAVKEYNKAIKILKSFNEDVRKVVDQAVENVDTSLWNTLKNKTSARDTSVGTAEKLAREAIEKIEKYEMELSKASNASNHEEIVALRSKIKVLYDHIDTVKTELYKNKDIADMSEKYWRNVEKARNYFIDEIESIFPGINLSEHKLNLSKDDLDLFITHAYSHVLAYQKELERLQTEGELRLKRAIDAVHGSSDNEAMKAQLEFELESERRKMTIDNQKKIFQIRADAERQLRHHLKQQAEAHIDHLNDAIALKENELKRNYTREMEDKLALEKANYKLQLATMLGKMRGMDAALQARAESERSAHQAQALWAACQSLWATIRSGEAGVNWRYKLRPLKNEIRAISKVAEGDELVAIVVQNIPREAQDRGVFPEEALRERFMCVEEVARKVALVPEGGASIPIYILSYLQSIFILKPTDPISQDELEDKEFDYSKLDTYEILNRARYFVDRGNLMQALKYMNLLDGAPRRFANDWMNETRLLLETQQAANTLMAHAAASGLLYL